MSNPVLRLQDFGVSVWLDSLRRGFTRGGDLARLIRDVGLKGVTSNPQIFMEAIARSDDYDEQLAELAATESDPKAIYEAMAFVDIRQAADALRPVFDRTQGGDGFVSLEVAPELAFETRATMAEAAHLWQEVDRPNVLIKIPGTQEGLQAIEESLYRGININITLLFSRRRTRAVQEAYLRALERRLEEGRPLETIHSVASFFLSRIDTKVDQRLEAAHNDDLLGRAAMANAKLAYQDWREVFSGARWERLAGRGARSQRLLWASTSTKDPRYSDIRYVQELIGPDVVNTMPLQTLEAYLDHGHPRPTLEEGLEEAQAAMAGLEELGIDFEEVCDELLDEGVEKFARPFQELLVTIGQKRGRLVEAGTARPKAEGALGKLEDADFGRRLWDRDARLWTDDPAEAQKIADRLGWLESPDEFAGRRAELTGLAGELAEEGFDRALLLGMGGSSLCPEVFARTFQPAPGHLALRVLDSTHPTEVEGALDWAGEGKPLFLVSSKSGTTAETLAFYRTAWERHPGGEHFVAITDPGSSLADQARAKGFRRVFLNPPDIGGRYSALSYFGLVPAALMGLDVGRLLERGRRAARDCGPQVPAAQNPGLLLAAAMADHARAGRDKLTLVADPSVGSFGLWVEQLIAESTGKAGRGILPVAAEAVALPQDYGPDRLFVYLRQEGTLDPQLARLEGAGHPVVRLELGDPYDLGYEFLRWEIATAAAGFLLGINPFDEPNVQEAKDATRAVLEGGLPSGEADLIEDGLGYFGTKAATGAEALGGWLAERRGGDYLAVLAYLPAGTEARLQEIRHRLRGELRLATTLGLGPRYLHSTGQLHKGGPESGLFLLLTQELPVGPAIPGQPHDFATLLQAQALGDLEALRRKGRRVLRVHLPAGAEHGLRELRRAVEVALA